MLTSLRDLEKFVNEYANFHKIKPNYKCKLAFFSGSVREVEVPWLISLNMTFKYIKGDNTRNFEKTERELEANRIIYSLAKQERLLQRTSLSHEGYACIHIIFDKLITPFDSCIDLKLLLYDNVEPIRDRRQYIFDDLNKVELEALLDKIHQKGFILNYLLLGQKYDQEATLAFRTFQHMTSHAKPREREKEYKKLQKMLNVIYDESCLGCGCASVF